MLTNRSQTARQNVGRLASSMSVSVDRVRTTFSPRRTSSARSSFPMPSVMSFSVSPPGKFRPGFPGSMPPCPGSTTIVWGSRKPVIGFGAPDRGGWGTGAGGGGGGGGGAGGAAIGDGGTGAVARIGAGSSSRRASHGFHRYLLGSNRGTWPVSQWSGRNSVSRATYGAPTSGYVAPSKRKNGDPTSKSNTRESKVTRTAEPSRETVSPSGRASSTAATAAAPVSLETGILA